MLDESLIAADVDFKPLIDNYLKTLRANGMNNIDISLYIKTARGRNDFIQYCDACIRMELIGKTGLAPDVIKNNKEEQKIVSADS